MVSIMKILGGIIVMLAIQEIGFWEIVGKGLKRTINYYRQSPTEIFFFSL
jgi:hypothetical protein